MTPIGGRASGNPVTTLPAIERGARPIEAAPAKSQKKGSPETFERALRFSDLPDEMQRKIFEATAAANANARIPMAFALARLRLIDKRRASLLDLRGLKFVKAAEFRYVLSRSPEHLKELRSLNLRDLKGSDRRSRAELSSSDFARIARLTNLRCLDLTRDGVTDSDLAELSQLTKLETLHLGFCLISDKGLASLARLHALTHLDLKDVSITGSGFAALADTRIAELNLAQTSASRSSITEAGLERIAKIRSIESLDLSGVQNLTAGGFRHLADLPLLTHLKLARTHITDDQIAEIAKIGSLRQLDLGRCNITDHGLAQLANLHNIETLNLASNERISATGLAQLEQCKRLTHLDVGNIPLGDAGFDGLMRLTELRTVNLSGTNITDEGLAHIASLKYLRALDVSGNQKVSSVGLRYVLACEAVAHLNLQFTGMEDEETSAGFRLLKKFSKLRSLRVTPSSYRFYLHRTDGEQNRIDARTRQNWDEIAALKNLTHLDISQDSFTETQLDMLSSFHGLTSLRIKGLFDFEKERLARALPRCKIECS